MRRSSSSRHAAEDGCGEVVRSAQFPCVRMDAEDGCGEVVLYGLPSSRAAAGFPRWLPWREGLAPPLPARSGSGALPYPRRGGHPPRRVWAVVGWVGGGGGLGFPGIRNITIWGASETHDGSRHVAEDGCGEREVIGDKIFLASCDEVWTSVFWQWVGGVKSLIFLPDFANTVQRPDLRFRGVFAGSRRRNIKSQHVIGRREAIREASMRL